MAAKEYLQNSIILQSGQSLDSISLITKGSVRADSGNISLTLAAGDIIGIADISAGASLFTYTALEDTAAVCYPHESPEDLLDLFRSSKDISILFINSALKQINELLKLYVQNTFAADKLYRFLTESLIQYKNLCIQYGKTALELNNIESLLPFEPEKRIDDWMIQYYEALRNMENSSKIEFFQQMPSVSVGFLCGISQNVQQTLPICDELSAYIKQTSKFLLDKNEMDLFTILKELLTTSFKVSADTGPLNSLISLTMKQMRATPYLDPEYLKNRIQAYFSSISAVRHETSDIQDQGMDRENIITTIAGSLKTILKYSQCSEKTANEFRTKIAAYIQLPDKNSDDSGVHKLRMEITKMFYPIYEAVFINSLTGGEIPPVVKMFLYFGYMDETLSGLENAVYLYNLAVSINAEPENGIYTFYDWLVAIYIGNKEPSRNEFDVDYTAYIHEQKVSKKITSEQEAAFMKDTKEKMLYELHNLFPIVNKVTFGRITTFCPVFTSDNVSKSLESSLVTPDILKKSIDGIRAIDYGAFYKESIFSDAESKIAKEMVHTEILPDIILMPNIGIRGIMWQEIEGMKRLTPSRFVISIFSLTDINECLIRLTAEYRWEICKRVQGARWNDVSDPSLTSDYCDYIQFYRKNNDLSSQAKEQIKTNLMKVKNNYRESFVRDYLLWILFEGGGSPRLNKVARTILFNYCPFSSAVRSKLESNPLYTDVMNRYLLKKAQRLNHMNNIIKKMNASGIKIPDDIQNEVKYIEL